VRVAAPRSALVTGANGGIGEALCAAFHKAGWHVTATDLHPQSRAACDKYVNADLVRFSNDAAYRADRLKQFQESLPEQGKLAALINNAAVQIVAPVEKLASSDWFATYNVNVIAPFLLVQGLLPDLEAASGAVINVASIHATQTKPGFTAYATSKAALVGLTRALAVELGGRVRVNAICPAAVSTPMLSAGFAKDPQGLAKLASYHPSGTIGTPDEVAAFVVMLASDASKYVTGAILNLDGGISSRLFDPA
jgi:NAD(P)-dependent dehydrogenase (short-subunit alcohol dehydrogenase family)